MQAQADGARLDVLAARSGYSERQTRRKFKQSLGMSPKTFARTLRLRTVLQHGRPDADWAELAAAAGFYDQSHLIHDFKSAFAMPPGAFFGNPRLSALSRFGILDET
jgi:transcriptional regulator GlxA family with amidase domain